MVKHLFFIYLWVWATGSTKTSILHVDCMNQIVLTEQNFYASEGWFILIALPEPPSDILVRASSPTLMGGFQ
jgi:hypothetical protein